MEFLVSSPMVRLDAIRDLKGAGYAASAPAEEDQGDGEYTLHVRNLPSGEEERVVEIVLAVDPSARRVAQG
jgi:hypothetical protein